MTRIKFDELEIELLPGLAVTVIDDGEFHVSDSGHISSIYLRPKANPHFGEYRLHWRDGYAPDSDQKRVWLMYKKALEIQYAAQISEAVEDAYWSRRDTAADTRFDPTEGYAQ